MSIPVLTQILQKNADEIFTAEIVVRNWQGIAEQIGYCAEAITVITAAEAIAATAAEAASAATTTAKAVATTTAMEVMATTTAIRTSAMALVTSAVTLLTAIALVAGLWIGGVFQDFSQDIQPVYVEHYVTFSGGDEFRVAINPKKAEVWAANERGELTAHRWEITAEGSTEAIYSGEGGVVYEALIHMYTNGKCGDYMLRFIMEDAAGVTYKVKRQFTIWRDY
jgi:hypothetical protein